MLCMTRIRSVQWHCLIDPNSVNVYQNILKDDGTLYVEVKMKDGGRESGGPPFHFEKEDLIQNFGKYHDYVSSLGEVYSLNIPGMKQKGHILRRSLRR